ncbi:hypothetical protein EVG20_g4084 [Dentipellis fragilis]|uniref:Peptidase A1 domain-containing protein n=1 Tax=Dentipellis fragilis TaxID=205917 RepID=A0A4Y9Z0X6_9AGAM|nr:hypothetical protein EVG20_g4084 [Dentipellis fragilis]
MSRSKDSSPLLLSLFAPVMVLSQLQPSSQSSTGNQIIRTSPPLSNILERLIAVNCSTITSRAPRPLRVPLIPVGDDLFYTASIAIGTNPGTFTMLMDTGSSDIWVYASQCPQRGRHNGVAPETSPQMRVNPAAQWSVPYEGTGQISGVMAQDTVNLGGLPIPGYAFGMAGLVASPITGRTVDGVLGFGTPLGARMRQPNIAQVLAHRGVIPAPILGWTLPRNLDGGRGGELSLGAPNQAKFNPATLTPPIPNLDDGHWRVPVTGAKVNGAPIPAIGNRVAVLDTATSQIIMPLQDAGFINQQLGALMDASTRKFYIPCNTNLQLSLTIANQDWAIDSRDLVDLRDMRPNGFCISMIQGGAANFQGAWLLGATFMKNAYVIMDYATNEIQLARLN